MHILPAPLILALAESNGASHLWCAQGEGAASLWLCQRPVGNSEALLPSTILAAQNTTGSVAFSAWLKLLSHSSCIAALAHEPCCTIWVAFARLL
jgi:hypothetical protein